MKKCITIITIAFAIASCVPPGKLHEALETNAMLSNKYDSLNNKLADTVTNFTTSLSILNNNVNSLKDSVSYYRALASKPPVITEGGSEYNIALTPTQVSSNFDAVKSRFGL